MGNYHIRRESFLAWYFDYQYSEESEEILRDLSKKMVFGLITENKFTITTEEVFKLCNHDAIPLRVVEEFDQEDYRHLEDLNEEYTLQLI